MYKKTLAVLLVVLMLVMGGVKIKAESCEVIDTRTYRNCEGNNCYKNKSTSAHYIVQVNTILRCWDNGGREYITEEPGGRQNSGCC